jgi:hypothetical protein
MGAGEGRKGGAELQRLLDPAVDGGVHVRGLVSVEFLTELGRAALERDVLLDPVPDAPNTWKRYGDRA